MFALRRKAVQSADRVGKVTTRVSRRWASAEHGKTGHDNHHSAGSSTDHGHHHAGPKNESFGTGFFVVLAAIPISIGVYQYAQPSADGTPSGLTKLIDSYSYYTEKWAARNALHVSMLEQAAFDRNLFQSDTGSAHVNLRFPEQFNTGSPWNVPAGHRARDMEQLVAHYEKFNKENEDKKR
ncbi:hypothetical protein SS1G_01706 [Sclerotinia sclerotiorum 1980 UF-70]|uniref:NADH-ubiquinone oxidoreductase 17.8 kDa subunit n=2 Tax=Sclerotinia sclerotiorum (strain ATCC 18683 / 1980 / Ss-1) TaxID=665079 RepID=A7E8S8_SCLS1|nr:hypothetical protein SS1G_01706 [Sclerotinia sclerotiorum 1980 UF-70]APA05900.1 hypothetical protein sscle_01g006700 [Sclerotinia sclerotiorum 1980 UF-70]EDN96780.1 hypothetical protein SS1G_01706 [Sclerotinia sclerotiorum 1980 UF-70]